MSLPYCLTTTIDKYSTVGDRYYHNIENNNRVLMRPRIPLRYDFNDISIIKLSPNESTRLKNFYRRIDNNRVNIPTDLYRFKRTSLSMVNTFLLYVVAIMLILISMTNMRKTINTLQEDTSLTLEERLRFRIGFILSFVVLLFLSCYLVLSIYELFRNVDKFTTTYVRDTIRYKTLRFPDGNYLSWRFIILFFVLLSMALSIAEVFNLFFMETRPSLLILFIPIVACCLLFSSLFTLP